MPATSAIIPASGRGRRIGEAYNKAFIPIAGKPLIVHTLTPFEKCEAVDEIVLVVNELELQHAADVVRECRFSKVNSIVAGGEERQDSVRNGLRKVRPEAEIVAIHDGARPLVTGEIITAAIEAARESGAALAAVPVTDTIKSSLDGRFVTSTLEREKLYAVQTPQTFSRRLIETAYERAYADRYFGTDDASLVERLGEPVAIVRGSYENIKVTTPPDVATAEAIIAARGGTGRLAMRVGHGYDVHRFGPGRKLFLGGIEFPGEEGLLGHSDADVLLHALMDAILGAAGAGDIGGLFPDTDPAYKNVRSTVLIRSVVELTTELGWRIGNVDTTLVADRPRIASHVARMRETIAEALGIAPMQVNVKASTSEGLGFVGEGLGIECHAVAILYPA